MKIKNVYNTLLLIFAALSLYSCTDVENKESYTGRSEGPATKLNVLRNGEAVGDALQFSMGATSILLGVDCDGDWTAEVDGDWSRCEQSCRLRLSRPLFLFEVECQQE